MPDLQVSTEVPDPVKHARSESLSEDVNMEATCTRKKWVIGISMASLAVLIVIALSVSVPLAAARATGVAGAQLAAVDPCQNFNCTVCPCHLNSTCAPSAASPTTPVCLAGPLLPDGSKCNDGDSSTMLDTCRAGICKGVPLSCANVDCSGPNYSFDACHGVALCELRDGATNCVSHRYADGYDCSSGGGNYEPRRCWKGSCIPVAQYNQSYNRDPCRRMVCPDFPPSGPDSCWQNGTGKCNFDGTYPRCGYKPEEVNTPCVSNGTAGTCGAFGNCQTKPFAAAACVL